ncbi:hypothetical protein [Duncaniella freteri]|uniref:hypothetical protein n=2 Tax=Duncaniella TaxID=2518495 RepID=UPI0032B21399
MKHIKITMALAVALAGFTSCDEDYDVTIPTPDVPYDAEMEAALSKYDVLTEYASKAGVPFGVSVSPEDFASKKLAYSIVATNYTQVEAPGLFTPAKLINEEGVYNFSSLSSLISTAGEAGVSVFGPALCSASNLPADYLKKLIAPIVIPYEPVEPETGEDLVVDFENDELGKTYPMSAGSEAKVVEDPEGISGKVLMVGTNENPANHSYVRVKVKLPDGRKLGDYNSFKCDMKTVKGEWGWGGKIIINNREIAVGNPNSFGAVGNGPWARGGIKISFVDPSDAGRYVALTDDEKDLTEFDFSYNADSGEGIFYLDNFTFNWETAGDDTGLDNVLDFEGDNIGKDYPTTNGGVAKIVEDPEGKSGKVLQVGTAEAPVNQSFAKVTIKLPNGHKLGDYEMFQVDMKTIKGQYGGGMRFIINGREFTGANAASSGATEGGPWARGGIRLSFVDSSDPSRYLELTEEEKALTEFEFAVGSATGAGFYYLDNYTFKRVVSTEDTVIEKTPEEKAEIIGGEFDKWIDGLTAATGDKVTDMIIYDEPFDDESAAFNWADYIGEDYVAKVQAKINENAASDMRYFVSQTLVISDNTPAEIAELKRVIEALEQKGVTVDAVNLVLSSTFSEDYATQEGLEAEAVAAMQALSAFGKPVRISDFAVRVIDRNNLGVNPSTINISERRAIGEYYAEVIKAYKAALGENAIGFNLSKVLEDGSYVAPWAGGGNRNYIYEGLVNGLTK